MSEGTQKFSLGNQSYIGHLARQSMNYTINNDGLTGPSYISTHQSNAPHKILGENSNSNQTFKVSTLKVENKKKIKKELKKHASSKKSIKHINNKTPRKVKNINDSSISKKIENSLRSSHFGLKEISKKVKDIVKKLKKTSYKEISDLIVCQLNEKDGKDEKNIRRRIYDSLNVMKAMNLFEKDPSNKFIVWKGDKTDQASNDEMTSSNFSFKKRRRSMIEDDNLDNENFSIEEFKYIIVNNLLKLINRNIRGKNTIVNYLWRNNFGNKIIYLKSYLKETKSRKVKFQKRKRLDSPLS